MELSPLERRIGEAVVSAEYLRKTLRKDGGIFPGVVAIHVGVTVHEDLKTIARTYTTQVGQHPSGVVSFFGFPIIVEGGLQPSAIEVRATIHIN